MAAGCKTNTFGTRNVAERERRDVLFLKNLHHARQIRQRILECFERAANPTLSASERARLLSFVVVGGGATSCEFATEQYWLWRPSATSSRTSWPPTWRGGTPTSRRSRA